MEVTNDLPDIDSQWSYQDPAGSEGAFRELIPRASTSGHEPYLAELFTQIARAEGLQGRFDEARADLDRAESLIGPADIRPRIRLLLERGRVLNSSGQPAEAKPVFLAAFELALRSPEEFLAIDAAHMVAIVEGPEEALAWNLRALNMARQAKDERAAGWQGSLYNNIGWTCHDLKRYGDALEYFEAGLAFQLQRGREREARIAAWTVGRCLRSLGRMPEALALQLENLETATAAGDPGGFIEEEIGECLLALGREPDAKQHFVRAFEALSRDAWLSEHEPARIQRLRELSRSDGS